MLKRIYIHNYKAFQNFELKFDDFGSSLFLGKNGSGKSSLVEVFKIFQGIGRGTTQLSDLVSKKDFNIFNPESSMKLEIDVLLEEDLYRYHLNFCFDTETLRPRILSEQLSCNEKLLLDRTNNQIALNTIFPLTFKHNQLALPNIQVGEDFKEWLSKILVISPIPAFMHTENNDKTEQLNYYCTNTSSWLSNMFSQFPKSYLYIYESLSTIFPDLDEITNKKISEDSHQLGFIFTHHNIKKNIEFSQLSYGERIFVLWSAILASVKLNQISLCVWDEPENYISIIEIQQYFNTLKQTFNDKAQFIATTHNPETMRMFSTEDIFIFKRENHFHIIQSYPVSEKGIDCDIAEMIKAGLVEL